MRRHALSAQFALGPAKDIVVNFDAEMRAIQVEPSAKASCASRS